MSIGARMLRLRDPETGQALPDERLLPHIGMICESMLIAHALWPFQMPRLQCLGVVPRLST